jgi:GNAT superfamily N-acetyltransferase
MTTAATRNFTVTVSPVRSHADRDAFLRLPWRIYRDDPAWVPPLLLDRKDFLDPKKHPFYRHGEAQAFIALRDGEVIGRALASHDPRYDEAHGGRSVGFGMFETVEDPRVAHALLDAAVEWGRARGCTRLWGPVDYSANYQIGLLVDGFETPPRVMMNHNPAWYAGLIESYGLARAKDLYAYWITDASEPPERWRQIADKVMARGLVNVRPLDMKHFDEEAARIKRIYNDAWEKNWGFVKMTDAEFDHLAKDLKLLAEPELVLIAEVAGETAGFSLALPDINEALRHLPDGRLTRLGVPVGLAKLLWHKRQIRTLRLLTLGVLEPFRRRGLTELLILRTYDVGRQLGFNACEMSWTLEDNVLINRPIETLGGKRYKTYRVYEKAI